MDSEEAKRRHPMAPWNPPVNPKPTPVLGALFSVAGPGPGPGPDRFQRLHLWLKDHFTTPTPD